MTSQPPITDCATCFALLGCGRIGANQVVDLAPGQAGRALGPPLGAGPVAADHPMRGPDGRL